MLIRCAALLAAACTGAIATKDTPSPTDSDSDGPTESAPTGGETCPGIPVEGSLREIHPYGTYGPYQQYFCEADERGAATPVCQELFGTADCPSLQEFVEVTRWFGDSPFQDRALYRCDFSNDGFDIDEAYFDQAVGSSTHHWALVFDHRSGLLASIGRNAADADGHPEDKLCCEGVLLDIASYTGDIDIDTAGCALREPYTAADFGLCEDHTGCSHSARP